MKKILLFLIGFILIISSCSEKSEPASITDQEMIKISDPIVGNLLAGFNEVNYEKFSRDFDAPMKEGLNANVFMETRQTIHSKIGNYISKQFSRIERKEKFIAVIYDGKFEQESGVTIRVVFQKYGNKYLVTGLWFDSPKLRE